MKILVAVLSLLLVSPTLAQTPVCFADAAGACVRVGIDGQGVMSTTGRRSTSWQCGVAAQGASLLECKAAAGAGTSHYITDIVVQSSTSTAGTFAIQSGTGTNCATATAAVYPSPPATTSSRFASTPNTAAPAVIHFTTPIKVTALHAVCVIGVGTNTANVQIHGYTAP